jgi:hypothetical protein
LHAGTRCGLRLSNPHHVPNTTQTLAPNATRPHTLASTALVRGGNLFLQDALLAAIPAAPKSASMNPSTVAVPVGTGRRWLFLDASRIRSRRWCTMEDCGGNEKRRGRIENRPRLLFCVNL